MTIGSLFSGIGGLEMGLEMCGLGPVAWQCDSDPYARAVLARHWPTVKRYDDVRAINGTATRVDVVCGGFPCQDISNAGKRAGIAGERSSLWFEFARVIRVVRPRIVFVENVAALANRGLDAVLGSLAALGFDAEWGVFSAAQAGALHRRERLFVLAYAGGLGEIRVQPQAVARGEHSAVSDGNGVERILADPLRPPGRQARDADAGPGGEALGEGAAEPGGRGGHVADAFGEGQLQPEGRLADIGRWPGNGGGAWPAEPDVGRVAHGVPARTHRLRLLGNAVVPQQAALAFRALISRAQ